MTTTNIYHVHIGMDYNCTIIPVYRGREVQEKIVFNLQDFFPLGQYISDELHNKINKFIPDNVSDTNIYKNILKQYKEIKKIKKQTEARYKTKEKAMKEKNIKVKLFTEEYNNLCKKYNICACVEVDDRIYIADIFEEFINN